MRDSQGGNLKLREKKQLEDLERDLTRIKKAREQVGSRAPQFGAHKGGKEGRERGPGRENRDDRVGGGHNRLGKRRRDESDSEETDEDVRRIPWPRDTPPPIPRQPPRQIMGSREGGPEQERDLKTDNSLPPKPPAAASRTTYESKAQVRDLRKEATQAFMPSVVKRKIEAVKGKGPSGKLLEENEVEKLESEGYQLGGQGRGEGQDTMDEAEALRLREEEAAFEREIATAGAGEGEHSDDGSKREGNDGGTKRLHVTMEEMSDEDM